MNNFEKFEDEITRTYIRTDKNGVKQTIITRAKVLG